MLRRMQNLLIATTLVSAPLFASSNNEQINYDAPLTEDQRHVQALIEIAVKNFENIYLDALTKRQTIAIMIDDSLPYEVRIRTQGNQLLPQGSGVGSMSYRLRKHELNSLKFDRQGRLVRLASAVTSPYKKNYGYVVKMNRMVGDAVQEYVKNRGGDIVLGAMISTAKIVGDSVDHFTTVERSDLNITQTETVHHYRVVFNVEAN